MKFGKLNDISKVDFRLPEMPEFSNSLLKNNAPKDQKSVFYTGCTGWSMKEWVGHYYPPASKSANFLTHYAQQFSCIELNTTHYRIPTDNMIDNWYHQSSQGFKFCPKLPRSISHKQDLAIGSKQITVFCKAIAGLKEKLGPCFLQLPPYFGPDKLPILDRFLSVFPIHTIPLSVEVRHPDWFKQQQLDALLNCLSKHKAGTIFSDVAGRRDALHLGMSNRTFMLRFVGNALHPTDYQRIDAWVDFWTSWMPKGIESVYFFAHQPDNLLAPATCMYLQNKLEAAKLFVFPQKTKPYDDGQMSLF